MDFETLKLIENEAERTAATYEIFNEDSRLNRSQAARVEFVTSVRAIESVLFPGARILDVGAGAGEYSLYFAQRGYDVTAVELSPANIAAFEKKIEQELWETRKMGEELYREEKERNKEHESEAAEE